MSRTDNKHTGRVETEPANPPEASPAGPHRAAPLTATAPMASAEHGAEVALSSCDPVTAPSVPLRALDHQRTPTPTRPSSPTPTATLLAELQGLDVEAVEAVLVGVRAAWESGDQKVIADALIGQALALEAVGAKLLRRAGREENPRAMETYAGIALRAFDQARKALSTLAGLKEKPSTQTNVQVNVAGTTTEILGGAHGERLVG